MYLALNKHWEILVGTYEKRHRKKEHLWLVKRETVPEERTKKRVLLFRREFVLPSSMERASSLRGNSEIPPVPAEPWMSGTAFRRPVLAEDAKLLTTGSTSVIFDESVLIATSTNRMCTWRRGWAYFEVNVHSGGWKAWLDQNHNRLENLLIDHTLHLRLLLWSWSFHLHISTFAE